MMERIETNPPTWLGDKRRTAWEAYRDLPLPDRVDHAWRYTDPRSFIPSGDPREISRRPADHDLAPWCKICSGEFQGDGAALGISVNEWVHTVSLPGDLEKAGVRLIDLARAVREDGGLMEPYLGRLIPGDAAKLEALNLAAWHGGFLLQVPAGVQIDRPVHLFVNDDGDRPFFASRILVVMGRDSSMTLFTEYTSRAETKRDGRRVNAITEIFQEQGTRLRHVTVQRFSRGINSYLATRARLAREADLVSVVAAFGGAISRVDTGTLLCGPGAQSRLVGFAFGEENQHLDHHAIYRHQAADTRSDLDFKVVLKDRARSAFTGLLRIAEDAPRCEAYQENRNILLSDEARADTVPELEILNEEVHCSHGATVGPLDEEQIYYLTSRGIGREEAVRLIVGGFLEPTLAAIPGDLQSKVRRCVDERLRKF